MELVYSIILIILALLLISDAKIIRNNINYLNKAGNLYFFANGSISSLMGIGGGTLSVPYFSFFIAYIKPIAEADAIDLLISAIKNYKYGTDKVPPPIPISELIDPLAKK